MILLLESLHPDAEAHLAPVAPLLHASDPDRPPSDLSSVRAILTRGRGPISSELMDRCPALEVIARVGAGLDNLDTGGARDRGVPVIFAPGLNANTVAEHTLALMLDLSRKITRCARDVAKGRWESRGTYGGDELRGRTLGILGYGNIGRRVAELATAFGMGVRVGEHLGRPPRAGESVDRMPLAALLPAVDVLTLHLPLTPATRGILGPREFELLKPGALLINTARGALVEGASLRESLGRGHLGGYGADVLEQEPPDPNDPLLASERTLVTPHVASLTRRTYRDLCLYTAENVARVLQGEPPDANSVFNP